MNSIFRRTGVLVASLSLVCVSAAFADSPVRIDRPDSHSVEVKGKVNLYRVQIEGMNFGQGQNKADAEVFVTLDSKPGMIYTLSLHQPGSKEHDPVNQEIAQTLRDAYVSQAPVTLYHQIAIKKDNNFRIMMVQLN